MTSRQRFTFSRGDYLIVCSAGHGQASGVGLPLSWFARVSESFGVIHRRVQDSSMQRLHLLRETGMIKGFVLPYLGRCPTWASATAAIGRLATTAATSTSMLYTAGY